MMMMMKWINFLKKSPNKILTIRMTMTRMKKMKKVKMSKRKVPRKKIALSASKKQRKVESSLKSVVESQKIRKKMKIQYCLRNDQEKTAMNKIFLLMISPKEFLKMMITVKVKNLVTNKIVHKMI